MVGRGYQDDRGPFVYVEAAIRGRHSDGQVAAVTFTAETWNYIHNEMDRRYPELRILGWYHSPLEEDGGRGISTGVRAL